MSRLRVTNPPGSGGGSSPAPTGSAFPIIRTYPFAAIPGTIRGTATTSIAVPAIHVDSTVGSNKGIELGEIATSAYGLNNELLEFDHFARVRMYVTLASQLNAGEMAGLELGSFGALPPLPASPVYAVAQLRWNCFSGLWQFCTAKGDGSAALVTNGPNTPDPTVDWVTLGIATTTAGAVDFYLNAAKVASVAAGAASAPDWNNTGATSGAILGLVVFSGATALSRVIANFTSGHVEVIGA